ncbi:multidrug efflux system protein MdtO [Salmonella enterica subsp. arizonae]|uniref:Multidrug efflux system protein MdtO n=1 Tax=Salmonella enterica subsp. arizonae TaxID=59203 RepID=A0A379S944_SALER|nr:multidrug efflux system protein MdtO [Salmonella enterica subsp. arizonae]
MRLMSCLPDWTAPEHTPAETRSKELPHYDSNLFTPPSLLPAWQRHSAFLAVRLFAKIPPPISSFSRKIVNWPMIFIWQAPAGRRRSGGDNSTIRSSNALIQQTLSGSHTLAEAKLRERNRNHRRNCWKQDHSYRSPRWVCLIASGHRRMAFSAPMRWTRRSWVWMARIIRKPPLVCSPGLISIFGAYIVPPSLRLSARKTPALAETAAVELSLTTGVAQLLLQYAGQLSDARSVTANS